MHSDTDLVDEFRRRLSQHVRRFSVQSSASRQLTGKSAFPSTVRRLIQLSQDGGESVTVKELIRRACGQGEVDSLQSLNGELLKQLTGLPPAKAVRALCIYFEMIPPPGAQWPVPALSSDEIERRIRNLPNPFDLLLHDRDASILDLGAGDLSFAVELTEQYLPALERRNRRLFLHCLDRLDAGTNLGSPLKPEPNRIEALKAKLGSNFSFFSDQDMFDLRSLDEAGQLAPKYTMTVCWAPATPAFAYEPTRLSPSIIEEDLRRTKGNFRHVRFHGEPALEVHDGDRALLFPSWKFEVIGPRKLLNLLGQRGSLCVLGAVDNQVFWELLSELLEDPGYRPPNRLFTSGDLPEIFGPIYRTLDQLPMGESIELAELGMLRHPNSQVAESDPESPAPAAFRYVCIKRGATFPNIPASSTARKFHLMAEELPPWFLTLIPR